MTKMQRSLRAMTDSAEARTETFREREYLVVPVVAMVEGVRFGAAQDEPELGLAQVFGKFPNTWDGRPIVVNHPQVDGVFVSAGSPEIRDAYEFGFTANTVLDDKKLKTEAWLDKELLESVEGADQFLQMIEAEEIIEVSVGFFSEITMQSGVFQGQAYSGVWTAVFPDHLAFLTDSKGACSINDGCGALRNNQIKETTMTLRTDSSNESCGCGGSDAKTCQCAASEVQTQTQTPAAEPAEKSSTTDSALESAHQTTDVPTVQAEPQNVKEFQVHAVASSVTMNSIWSLLSDALKMHLEAACHGGPYLLTFTVGDESVAVYEIWDGSQYCNKGIRYNVDDKGKVTFEGEPFNVRVVSHLYTEQEEDTQMTTQNSQDTAAQPTVQENAQTPATPKVLTQAEALAAVDPAVRAEIESAMKAHSELKDQAIKALTETGRCKFGDEYLRAQSLDTLNSLIELADVPNFSGRAAPAPTVQASAETENYTPAPSDIFAQAK